MTRTSTAATDLLQTSTTGRAGDESLCLHTSPALHKHTRASERLVVARRWLGELRVLDNESSELDSDEEFEELAVNERHGIVWSDDGALAAGIVSGLYWHDGNTLVILDGTSDEPGDWLRHEDGIVQARWVPGTHTLLVLGSQGTLAKLSVTGNLCEDLEWTVLGPLYPTAGPEVDTRICMEMSPSGAVAVLLSSRRSPAACLVCFAVYSTRSLTLVSEHLSTLTAVGGHVPVHSSLHVGMRAVAAEFGSFGTRVWTFDGSKVGKRHFTVQGLHGCSFSLCTRFIAGMRDGAHVVLDSVRGSQVLHVPVTTQGMRALSAAWDSTGHIRLHLGMCNLSAKDSETLIYKRLSF